MVAHESLADAVQRERQFELGVVVHAPQAIAAAAAGKHVLCEKPLAMNLADACAIVEAYAKAGVVLGTNHHLRNAASHQAIRQLVRDGAIGKPLFARVFHATPCVCRSTCRAGASTSRRQAAVSCSTSRVHDVDTLRFILDAEPVEAVAMTQGSGPVEDDVMAVLRFDSGVLAHLNDAFNVANAGTGIEIHGSAGSIFGRDVMTQQPIGEVRLRNADGERVIPLQPHTLYAHPLAAFNRGVQGLGTPSGTGEDGVRALAAALAVLEAARCGRSAPVHIG